MFRAVLVIGLLGFAAFHAARAWLESTTYFRDKLRDEIALRFQGDVTVGKSSFDFLRRVLVASDIALKDRRGAEPQIIVPSLEVKLPYSIVDSEGRITPERVLVRRGVVRLVERADGSFAPLDLIQVAATGIPIPIVAIEEGTVVVSGDGRLNELLDGILRPDLPRRLDQVRLASAPMPETSDYLIGFNGNLELPGLAPVTLFGGIGRDNSIRLELELRDLDLASPALRDTLAPALAERLERHVRGGRVSVEVELDLPAAAGAEARLRIHMHARDLVLRHESLFATDLTGISVEATFDGRNLRLHDIRVPAGPAGGGVASELLLDGVIEDLIGENGIDFSDWRFTARGRSIAFRDSIVSNLREPMLRRIIDDYDPDGRAEVFVELTRIDGQPVRPRWSLKPLGASASYVGHVHEDGTNLGFPYRVTKLEGEIAGDGPHVEIRHLRGLHAGFGLAEIDGTVDANGGHTLVDLKISAVNAPLADGKIRNALENISPGAGAIVDRFHPSGTVDATVRVYIDPETMKMHRHGLVTARSVDAAIDDFPYPLHFERGTVEFKDDLYTVTGLEAKAGATEVGIDGKIEVIAHQVGIEVNIRAKNARAHDPVLRKSLDTLLDRVRGSGPRAFEWSWLEPAGGFDVDVELRQEPGSAMLFRALLYPRDLDAVPKWFAVPIEGVVGRIEFGTLDPATDAPRTFGIELEDVRGTYRGGDVACFGSVSEHGLELDVRGDRLPITRDLLDAVDRTIHEVHVDAPYDVTPVVQAFVPGGRASMHLALPLPAPKESANTSRLTLRIDGGRLRSEALPGGELEDLGIDLDVDLTRGVAHGRSLDARIKNGAGRLRVHRFSAVTGKQIQWNGDLELADLALDARAGDWLPKEIAGIVRAESGTARLVVGSLAAEIDPATSDGSLANVAARPARARIALNDATFEVVDAVLREPVAVTGLSAKAILPTGTLDLDGDSRALGGKCRIDSFEARIAGLAVEGASANLDLARNRFELHDVVGRVADGTLSPEATHFVANYGSPPSIQGGIALEDGDLAVLLGQIGFPSTETRGRFTTNVTLSGNEVSMAALTGAGRVSIRDGRLADLPWLAVIYRRTLGYMLGEWLEPTFSSGDIDFRRDGDRIVLEQLRLDSLHPNLPLGLRLSGEGELGPGGIDIRLVPEILRSGDSIVAPLLRLITGQILSYRITGSLRNPKVQYRNVAMELFMPLSTATNQPRLVEPRSPVWRW